jgi:acyl carrier protein
MPAEREICDRLTNILVAALGVGNDDITPSATLQGDLGAESIDLLDIVFRLEREFGIEIPRGELFPDAILDGDSEFARDGEVTDASMAELRSRLPSADLDGLDDHRRLASVADPFTVGLLARYVARKLAAAACTTADLPREAAADLEKK